MRPLSSSSLLTRKRAQCVVCIQSTASCIHLSSVNYTSLCSGVHSAFHSANLCICGPLELAAELVMVCKTDKTTKNSKFRLDGSHVWRGPCLEHVQNYTNFLICRYLVRIYDYWIGRQAGSTVIVFHVVVCEDRPDGPIGTMDRRHQPGSGAPVSGIDPFLHISMTTILSNSARRENRLWKGSRMK